MIFTVCPVCEVDLEMRGDGRYGVCHRCGRYWTPSEVQESGPELPPQESSSPYPACDGKGEA
jgi:hypothetical protein